MEVAIPYEGLEAPVGGVQNGKMCPFPRTKGSLKDHRKLPSGREALDLGEDKILCIPNLREPTW